MKKGNYFEENYFEDYPFWIVLVSNLVSIAVYLIGAFIIYQLGALWVFFYLAYILILEFRLLGGHCTDCYYYGKICPFGKGKISSIFFRKGNVKDFCKMQMSWKNIVPDFLVSLIPLVIGIVLIVKDFDLTLLFLIIFLFVLAFPVSGTIRTKLACRHCKQRKLGCPAQKLFKKK